MKKIISLLLLLTFALTLFSCKKDEEIPKDMQLVSTDNVAYRFYVPKTWTINTTDNPVPSAYFSMTDGSNVSVTTVPVNEINTLAGYWEYCNDKYEAELTDYKLIGEVETLLVDDRNAAKYVYRFSSDGVHYMVMQTFVGNEGSIYAINYVSPIDNYDLHVDTVNTIISVFKFR